MLVFFEPLVHSKCESRPVIVSILVYVTGVIQSIEPSTVQIKDDYNDNDGDARSECSCNNAFKIN